MCSSCSSNNDQLLTTPTRFPASPRADDFIHDHSSTAHLLSILPNPTVLPPQHSQQSCHKGSLGHVPYAGHSQAENLFGYIYIARLNY